jgi:hypothetical protein
VALAAPRVTCDQVATTVMNVDNAVSVGDHADAKLMLLGTRLTLGETHGNPEFDPGRVAEFSAAVDDLLAAYETNDPATAVDAQLRFGVERSNFAPCGQVRS